MVIYKPILLVPCLTEESNVWSLQYDSIGFNSIIIIIYFILFYYSWRKLVRMYPHCPHRLLHPWFNRLEKLEIKLFMDIKKMICGAKLLTVCNSVNSECYSECNSVNSECYSVNSVFIDLHAAG